MDQTAEDFLSKEPTVDVENVNTLGKPEKVAVPTTELKGCDIFPNPDFKVQILQPFENQKLASFAKKLKSFSRDS